RDVQPEGELPEPLAAGARPLPVGGVREDAAIDDDEEPQPDDVGHAEIRKERSEEHRDRSPGPAGAVDRSLEPLLLGVRCPAREHVAQAGCPRRTVVGSRGRVATRRRHEAGQHSRHDRHGHGTVVVVGLQIAVVQIAAAPLDDVSAAGAYVVVPAATLIATRPMFCAPRVTVRVRLAFVHTALLTANAPSTLNVLDSWTPVSFPTVAV